MKEATGVVGFPDFKNNDVRSLKLKSRNLGKDEFLDENLTDIARSAGEGMAGSRFFTCVAQALNKRAKVTKVGWPSIRGVGTTRMEGESVTGAKLFCETQKGAAW